MPIDTSMYDTGDTNRLLAAAGNSPQAMDRISNAQGVQQSPSSSLNSASSVSVR